MLDHLVLSDFRYDQFEVWPPPEIFEFPQYERVGLIWPSYKLSSISFFFGPISDILDFWKWF